MRKKVIWKKNWNLKAESQNSSIFDVLKIKSQVESRQAIEAISQKKTRLFSRSNPKLEISKSFFYTAFKPR